MKNSKRNQENSKNPRYKKQNRPIKVKSKYALLIKKKKNIVQLINNNLLQTNKQANNYRTYQRPIKHLNGWW